MCWKLFWATLRSRVWHSVVKWQHHWIHSSWRLILETLLSLYYMACVCSQYNARSDWLIGLALFSRNNHRPITGLQKQSKKPYNNQLINLKLSVFTGKSQTSASSYWPRKVSVWDFPSNTSLSFKTWLLLENSIKVSALTGLKSRFY